MRFGTGKTSAKMLAYGSFYGEIVRLSIRSRSGSEYSVYPPENFRQRNAAYDTFTDVPQTFLKRYHSVNMLNWLKHISIKPPPELFQATVWAFFSLSELSWDVETLVWKNGDSFDHDRGILGVIIFGLLTIISLKRICSEFTDIPTLANPLESRNFRESTIRAATISIVLALAAVCMNLSELTLKHLGWHRHGRIAVYLLETVFAGVGFVILWRETKRLSSYPGGGLH